MKTIFFTISLKVVPEGPIDNKATLDQKMAWSRIGDKPLYEPTNEDPTYWRIYAALGGDELNLPRTTVYDICLFF